jgi:phosphoglucomutase
LADITDLDSGVDMDAIRRGGLTIGVDPLGGARVGARRPMAERSGST